MATSPEEVLSAPKWLEKLEEQREKRLKAKLGHEAGAGAPCQICGDKCPGLDLHFWRKICKICKCGKEDHDITDDDIYGFVQFTLLGSKPVKAKGILLKGRKEEVILDWTPAGSNNDVKKYLDEIPYELLPVKGSEAAKIRKQRLQKQIPAHDVDASLCHALTEEEIKEMEEYVAHIKNNSVGQGKIIRLPLYKSSQHVISAPNSRLLSHLVPANLASSENVNLLDPNLTNNLQNLAISDNPPLAPNSIIHPLTTTNVERHQEQFEKLENSTFEPTNANLDRVYSPNLNCAPSYINPRDQYQLPVSVRQPKDVKYPVNELPPTENSVGGGLDSNNALPQFQAGFVKPVVEEVKLAEQCRQPIDINYPIGTQNDNLGLDVPIFNLKTHPNFNTTGNVGSMQGYQPQNVINSTENVQMPASNTGHIQDYQPQNLINPTENQQNMTCPPFGIKDITYPGLRTANTNNKNSKMQDYQPTNLINPSETQQNLSSVGFLKDLSYNKGVENNFEGDNFNVGKPELPPLNLKCHE